MSSSQKRPPLGSPKLTFSADAFFDTQEVPTGLEKKRKQAQEFVERHSSEGRKVVLVTVSNVEIGNQTKTLTV